MEFFPGWIGIYLQGQHQFLQLPEKSVNPCQHRAVKVLLQVSTGTTRQHVEYARLVDYFMRCCKKAAAD